MMQLKGTNILIALSQRFVTFDQRSAPIDFDTKVLWSFVYLNKVNMVYSRLAQTKLSDGK